MAFSVEFKNEEKLKVFLSGDLDINSVENFRSDVLNEYENLDKDVELDLVDLKYIDSTGIGGIMTIYNEVNSKNHKFSVKNANRNIAKLFKITELDKLFNMGE